MLRKLVVGPYQSNCYILGCKQTKECLVIDPGDEVFRIVKEISRNGLKINSILITHGHIDHIGGAEELKKITKAPVLIHALDAQALNFRPDANLHDGQEIRLSSPVTHFLPVLSDGLISPEETTINWWKGSLKGFFL